MVLFPRNPHQKPVTEMPDRAKQIRHLWGLAGTAARGMNTDKQSLVYGAVESIFGKNRLSDLSDAELAELVSWLRKEDGHSSGLHEVLTYLNELAELVK